jgi:hypothetical protein
MDENDILLEILRYPVMTQPSGIRVYQDGLYRYRKGREEWEDVWYFTDVEMAELRRAIASAGIQSLDDHYDAKQSVADGTTVKWQITVEGEQYHIHLSPGAKVPALENLYHTFSTLRKLSPESSNWQVWQPDATYREFTVIGSVNAVDQLRPLITAMFVPSLKQFDGEIAVAPDTLLVKTDWITEDQSEQTKLYADGRYVRTVEDEMQDDTKLPLGQVLNVLHALQTINWELIPDRIDTT